MREAVEDTAVETEPPLYTLLKATVAAVVSATTLEPQGHQRWRRRMQHQLPLGRDGGKQNAFASTEVW